MKTNLIAKQLTKLNISPQLQNAIKLLQMSAMEINQEIQNIFENNPLIEKEDQCEDFEDDNCEVHYSHYQGDLLRNAKDTATPLSEIIEKTSSQDEDIKQHLMWQIHLLNISEKDKKIAETIVDYINDDGFLIKTIHNIFDDVYLNSEVTIDEVIAIQHLMQNLDPVGTCCIGIQESLLIQLQNIEPISETIEKSQLVIREFFDEYIEDNFSVIKKNIDLSENQILNIKKLIRSQSARPGSKINSQKKIDYIIPDIKIYKNETNWEIKANNLISPNISINENYVELIQANITDNDKNYLKENLREAKTFIKNINYRNDTLLNISQCIFNKQIRFFQSGAEKLEPLSLRDVAEEIGVHESTVSRLTNGKYVETPYGVFELKYFFSRFITNESGEEISSNLIKEKIKKIIKSENKSKPYSDDKIVKLLEEQNINIARRTVSKYRVALNFASSSKRKTK